MDRYEKVDAYTIRVIQEKASDVALVNLIKTRNDMLEDIKGLQVRLESLEVIIAKAKRLGIVPKEKDKGIKKKLCPLCKGTGISCPQCSKEK